MRTYTRIDLVEVLFQTSARVLGLGPLAAEHIYAGKSLPRRTLEFVGHKVMAGWKWRVLREDFGTIE